MPVTPLRRGAAMKRWASAIAALGLALSALAPASAQGVVIYRCTDANGALTIQNNTPCPKGSKQERRVMESAPSSSAPPFVLSPSSPAPVRVPPALRTPPAAPPAVPPSTEEPETTVADADRLPPPWLYECRTHNDESYLSDTGEPKPRCVTLNTTGLGGLIESGNNTSACEMKIDQCQRVPDGSLCEAWRRRLRAAESALRFGATEDRAKAEAEMQRLARAVRESTCGRPQ